MISSLFLPARKPAVLTAWLRTCSTVYHALSSRYYLPCQIFTLAFFPLPVSLSDLAKTQAIFTSSEQRKKSDDAYVHLYSKERIDILVRAMLTLVTVLLLLIPTALLFLVPETNKTRIVTILVFTLLFSAALMIFTKAKRHEIFGATAA